MMSTESVASAARYVERDWGSCGYSIRTISEGPLSGSAVAEVWAGDGSVFHVGSDRYGNTRYSEDRDELVAQLRALRPHCDETDCPDPTRCLSHRFMAEAGSATLAFLLLALVPVCLVAAIVVTVELAAFIASVSRIGGTA